METQALYDWNGIRIGDAGGRHQELIPDGKLCSAGADAFKGLDLAWDDLDLRNPVATVTDPAASGGSTFLIGLIEPFVGLGRPGVLGVAIRRLPIHG